MTVNKIPAKDRESFTEHLQKSTRILALCGAGLSASSGLPTFRGAGGLWRNYDATSLATPEAFEDEPGLVWQFYSYRRHMALNVNPNPAHYALAELARKRPEFITLTQNKDNFTDPIVPALAIPTASTETLPSTTDNTGADGGNNAAGPKDADISDATIPMADIPTEDLPQCPKCKKGLLRPGVVWFGEPLPVNTMNAVDEFVEDEESKIDLMLVIGTSAKVFPAAAYAERARHRGARIAVINMDKQDGKKCLAKGDWFFHGDAAVILPDILFPVIGDVSGHSSGSNPA
ncbi:MAG: hypothetical protein Q9202_002706 [Teloschistes flavicans]